ncbi:Rrf2 family transcriptional regulator [Maricaulis sp.]|uniref:Rrf2 family transcriptional regulator n=1 Tax=Maricaulis sp. TaxID=1486257 RepID=UPI001AFFCA68|nr:Rrf2 family transcriptional regulator [Maricaulis sp.]MBO6763785.1 Rrf2 family transcriptional regulator [Maricaulis sp.]
MRLTSFTNYALRMLQYTALRGERISRVTDIAMIHQVSVHHMVKIANLLGREGYLETIRGRSGGVRLARPADTITVGEVVRLTEAPLELAECFNDKSNTCPLIGVCRLSKTWRKALDAFLEVLDGVTIADIAGNRGELTQRLALDADGG